ncbi:hypothetical protein ACROYT_G030050 [Oculina patagonica]
MKAYLQEEKIPDPATAEDLERFYEIYVDVSKNDANLYSKTSLCVIRFSFNRHFKQVLNIDIIKDQKFNEEEIEKDLRLADDYANKLQKGYDQIVKEERDHDREEMREKDLEHEKQILNEKLQAALKQKELVENKSAVKFPKLSITPFSGTVIDWVRFESQFSAMVDSQSVPAVTKFSHLKELLVPSVRQAIDGLPFNEEGYERAKKYLREKYGHPGEVAGAYVINLLEIPTITERNVAKVHQFYEKVLFTIESLETLGKLESVQGVAYYVLVK